MDDWKRPSVAKENMAAATLQASRIEIFGESSWDLLGSTPGACPVSRGACSSCELDAMIDVKGVESSRHQNTTRTCGVGQVIMG